ncbi:MAG: sulfotransferase, partial [Alphaproteobacteria bacterium]|nr:sulfotransferase [Alphaproteobacteria bacterium]
MPTRTRHADELTAALQRIDGLLGTQPLEAERQARALLAARPGQPEATLLLGAALRRLGQPERALATLRPVTADPELAALAHFEMALAAAASLDAQQALDAMSAAVRLRPDLAQGWRDLGDQMVFSEQPAAFEAYGRYLRATGAAPALADAAEALYANRLSDAEHLLRPHLKAHPADALALSLLAEVGVRLGRHEDACPILARSLELAPNDQATRHRYALLLHRMNRTEEALQQIDALLAGEPGSGAFLSLKANILSRSGDYSPALEVYEEVLAALPELPGLWMSYGHALKTAGRQQDAIAAYRRSTALQPSFGEASWSLANLKTFRFADDEVAAMRAELLRTDLKPEDRYHLNFALGKALEDRGAYAESFANYRDGNALRRAENPYDPDETHSQVLRSETLFTPAFFAARQGLGCPAPDPIFVVGLPRSGSTLVEQILSSHSAIEGTMELPNIPTLALRLSGRRAANDRTLYPESVAPLNGFQLNGLGEEYLQQTRVHRRLGRPYFIDKMPNNFAHVGLIHLILPNARIIDARRHPLACCFSGFKQHFARGQNFTYDLTEIGRYYADYVRLMAHYDTVLPGRVHRVIYEEMVADPEREVHRLLEYCGLPFEEGCLRFYENDRAVRTASSEQVR